ncbi:hypothetical protein D3C80_924750 [compost metagenome]
MGLLLVGGADGAVLLERLEAQPVGFGLPGGGLGRIQALAGGLLGEQVIRIIEHGEHVALVHDLADIDLALLHLAANTKGLFDLIAGGDRGEIAVAVAQAVVVQRYGAHRPQCTRGGGRL